MARVSTIAGGVQIAFLRDLTKPEDVARLNQMLSELGDAVRSNTSSNGLADGVLVDWVTPATPDTDFTVPHTLGKRPRGYIVAWQSAAASVYDDSNRGSWTASSIVLKCSEASVSVLLLIF
jgi:hypothetical protein